MSTRSTDTNHFKQASDNIVQNENLDFSRANSLYSKEDMLSSENNQVGTHMISCALNPENEKEPVQTVDGYDIAIMADTGSLKTLWIPELPEGRYFFQGENSDNYLVYLEAVDKKWIAKCHPKANFVVSNTQAEEIFRDGETRGEKGIIGEMLNRSSNMNHSSNYSRMSQHHYFLSSLEIRDHTFSPIEIGAHRRLLYVEASYTMDRVFHNYYVRQGASIRIGRKQDNDIICQNPYISKHHAVIHWDGNEFLLRDENSSNGTYVNGRQEQNKVLQTGDLIYIMGLKIVVGPGLLSINSGNGRTYISDSSLREINDEALRNLGRNNQVGSLKSESNLSGGNFFNRTPRKKNPEINKTISIESPPMSLNGDHIPLLLRMGGSMVMSGASMLSGNYLSMVSMVLFPVLNQKYTEKQKKEYEQRRRIKYQEYLKNKEEEIIAEIKSEEDELNHFFPPTDTVILYPREGRRLWERLRTDNDFLQIRIGSGRLPLIAKIEYSEKRFSLDEDDLEDSMYELAQRRRYIDNVPIILPLVENYVCGVVGSHALKMQFAKRLIAQIAFLHGYDEVKLLFFLQEEDIDEMPFIRTLPHVWNDDQTMRYIATDNTCASVLSNFLADSIGTDLTEHKSIDRIIRERPYYIIFAFSEKQYSTLDIIKGITSRDQNIGVSILTFFEKAPKEAKAIISLSQHGNNQIAYLDDFQKEDHWFTIDNMNPKASDEMFHMISNTRLNIISQSYTLPKSLTFLELFGVGKVDHLNPFQRWTESNPIYSLATPVGVTAEGEPFILDLHENAHGPHGLVAGMTGSGKSEFLITYILSLSVNYHPDEVAFVLIDYKGGGLAGAFDDPVRGIHLPHLVGSITNLDGSAIQRSLMSINSELKRRQRIFNKAKGLADEGTMDIYAYQRLRRKGVVTEPLPHLFIISDEFAELKTQEPEFMDQLISTARIGRSLGVHLILATQKPSGVVNEQIRSNAKFKVCLKVQDRYDSIDMLQRPDAAGIRETGRFFLQVGYNELFIMGQSAWCGAEYEPSDQVITKTDESVQYIDSIGRVVEEVKINRDKKNDQGSQLVNIVKLLSSIAYQKGIMNRTLWKDELPSVIEYQDLQEKFNTNINLENGKCILGIIDDPREQQQYPFSIDLVEMPNLLIIGENRSGKTTLIQNILLSLSESMSPNQLNYYILDYSSRLLTLLKVLPHCGEVLLEDDEQSLAPLFELINKIIIERKKLFSELHVSSYKSAYEKKPLPLIVVVIDNFAALANSRVGENISYNMPKYLRDGVNYGIKYIVSCNHLSDINTRIRKQFGKKICLHLKDKYEYSDCLDAKVTFVPKDIPGRGIILHDERPLEVQIAMRGVFLDDKYQSEELNLYLERILNKHPVVGNVRRIPVISENASYLSFCGQFKKNRIPIGFSKKTGSPVAIPFRQLSMLSIYIGNPEGTLPILKNIIYASNKNGMKLFFIKRCENSVFTSQIAESRYSNATTVECKEETLAIFGNELKQEMMDRKEGILKYCIDAGIDIEKGDLYQKTYKYLIENTVPYMIVIESFSDFCASLDFLWTMLFDKMFAYAQKRNIYVIAFFEPDDQYSGYLYSGFNPDENIILLGGQFNKQNICDELSNIYQGESIIQYNTGIMKYRNNLYPITVPCGEIHFTEIDEDEKSIFG